MLARAVEFLRFMEVRQSIGEKRWPYVPHVAAVFFAKQQRDPNSMSMLLPATFLTRAWPVLPFVLSLPMASQACSRVVAPLRHTPLLHGGAQMVQNAKLSRSCVAGGRPKGPTPSLQQRMLVHFAIRACHRPCCLTASRCQHRNLIR